MDEDSNQGSTTRAKAPRLYHKKSRNGCQRCRARRVKCDEQKPTCCSCRRHSVPCIYKKPILPLVVLAERSSNSERGSSTSLPPLKRPNLLPNHAPGSDPAPQINENTARLPLRLPQTRNFSDVFEITETRSRRMLELRLLSNYISNTSSTFPACHNPEVRHSWGVAVTDMAMGDDNLLYGILSISALHLLRQSPADAELLAARQNYVGLSLHEHRRAVAQLNSKSADSVCFASSLVLIDSFASLQDRVLEPYSPPMQWINMARGAGSIFKVSLDKINDFEMAKITVVIDAEPQLKDNDIVFAEKNREGLLGLLSQDIAGGHEVWDDETREAYENTLSYIGGAQIANRDDAKELAVCRRMIAFASRVPEKFLGFIEEQRPRALVILAHFFALSAGLEDIWWIGNTGRREIGGIWKVLPPEWRDLMQCPLGVVGLTP